MSKRKINPDGSREVRSYIVSIERPMAIRLDDIADGESPEEFEKKLLAKAARKKEKSQNPLPPSKSSRPQRPSHELELQRKIGLVVRLKREELGITQEELAYRSDVPRSYFSDIERGLYGPNIHMVARIAKGLNISLAELFASAEV